MSFSTEAITAENATFAAIQQVGTATQLCPYTGKVLRENVRIFIAVIPKVPAAETPTINEPAWRQEAFIAEVHRLDELEPAMRQNASVHEHDSVWTAEQISKQAIQSIFTRIADWQEAFAAGNNAKPEREAQHFTNIKRL